MRLREALELAAKQSPTLQRARAEVRAASGRTDQSRSVLLPQITGSASYARVHGARASRLNSVGDSNATAGSDATYNRVSLGVAASQTLWDYSAIERLRAAGLSVDAASATRRAMKLQTELDVRRRTSPHARAGADRRAEGDARRQQVTTRDRDVRTRRDSARDRPAPGPD